MSHDHCDTHAHGSRFGPVSEETRGSARLGAHTAPDVCRPAPGRDRAIGRTRTPRAERARQTARRSWQCLPNGQRSGNAPPSGAETTSPAQAQRQIEVGDEDGLVGRVDFAYTEQRIAIEVQSYRWHSSRAAWRKGIERLNRL